MEGAHGCGILIEGREILIDGAFRVFCRLERRLPFGMHRRDMLLGLNGLPGPHAGLDIRCVPGQAMRHRREFLGREDQRRLARLDNAAMPFRPLEQLVRVRRSDIRRIKSEVCHQQVAPVMDPPDDHGGK